MNKLLKRARWLYAFLIGCVFYNRKYLRGRHFRKYSGHGWNWVLNNCFMQKIVGVNRSIPFPVSFRIKVVNWKNIDFDPDDMNIFQKMGNYYQAGEAKIHIGKGTQIANGVAIITANHDLQDITVHSAGKDVYIGKECWIASNAVILPGVRLGDHTIVGAGAVVTKSFPDGWCVIGGVPAKLIKTVEKTGISKEIKEQCDETPSKAN